MKFSSIFGIIVGTGMCAMWSFFIASGQVPELESEPYRIAFHLAAEFTTALGLLAASIGLLMKKGWAKTTFLFFAGMLTYSVIVSPGYYAQLGNWAFVVMFALILGLTLIAIRRLYRKPAGHG
jgi:hypothetical protein